MVFSIVAESIQQFCQAAIFISSHISSESIVNFLNSVGLTNIFFLIPFYRNEKSIYAKMHSLNINIMFAAESFAIQMHIFVFFEMIFMMKNPIGSATLRIKIYNTISFAVSIFLFTINLLIGEKHDEYTYKSIVENERMMVYCNFSLFLIMVFLGFLNIIYTLKRLGCKSFFKQTYYNKFLFGQIFMMLTYYTCLTPLKIISFNYALKGDFRIRDSFVIFALLAHSLLGFIQFLTRVLETNFYNMIWRCCKKTFCFWKKDLNSRNSSIDDNKEDVRK